MVENPAMGSPDVPVPREIPLVPGLEIPVDEESFSRSVASEYGRDEFRRKRKDEDRLARIEDLPDYRESTTSDLLAAPDDRPTIVVGGTFTGAILRAGHTARMLADSKVGKTTIALDFLRCSLTGERFLGFFPVEPVGDREMVGWVDPELGLDWKDYVRRAFVGCDESVLNRLRRVDTLGFGLDMLSEPDSDWLAEQLVGCSRVVLDSVSDLFSGDPSDAGDVRDLFNIWDKIRKTAGIREAVWVVHMNRNRDERSFGSAKWEARFNSLWSLLKEGDGGYDAQTQIGVADGDLGRFFKVVPGRNTAFPETPLGLDGEGRPVLDRDRLGTSRKGARREKHQKDKQEKEEAGAVRAQGLILAHLRELEKQPDARPVRRNELWERLGDQVALAKFPFLNVVEDMVNAGILTKEIGEYNAHYFGLTDSGRSLADQLPVTLGGDGRYLVTGEGSADKSSDDSRSEE